MLLSVAIRILLSKSFCNHSNMIDFAAELLKVFVKNFGELYGEENIIYNVHSLIHLADDARKYGPLDNVSSFPFENYLGQLKKLIRKPSQPLVQLVNRLLEGELVVKNTSNNVETAGICKKRHCNGPLLEPLKNAQQFSKLYLPVGFLSIESGDNCVQLQDSKIVLIRNIVLLQNAQYIIYTSFATSDNFFTYPVASKSVEIILLSDPKETLQFCSVDKITNKLVLLPVEIHTDTYVAMPFLHNV